MYESHFGLQERPFSIAPDPQYLFMSSRHKEAMAHLSYGLTQGGCFIVLTGEVGTGKTTLCRNLLDDLPDNVDVALILNANINENELLETICDELHVSYQEGASQKRLLDNLNQHLLSTFAENRHTVLIIDEAQLLSRDVLEQIRLLTNLETTKHKLLQIILIGQPELNSLLQRDDLRQLAQRITARYNLDALQKGEMEAYLNHRLSVAGCRKPLFSRQAIQRLFRLTEGIPRKINVLADHALLSAYSQSKPHVDAKTVNLAAKDVFIEQAEGHKPKTSMPLFRTGNWWPALTVLTVLLAGVLYFSVGHLFSKPESGMRQQAVSGVIDNKAVTAAEAPINKIDVSQESMLVDAAVDDAVDTKVDKPTEVEQVMLVQPVAEVATVESEEPVYADQTAAEDSPSNTDNVNPEAVSSNASIAMLLSASSEATGRIVAFRQLAALWQIELPATLLQGPCDEVAQQGLACVSVNDWQSLVNYNRPAILVLEDNDTLHRVVVTKVGATESQIQISDQSYQVATSDLVAHWTGKALIYWKPAEVGNVFFQQGDSSELIVWLRLYLNRALDAAGMSALSQTTSPLFDAQMAEKVFRLQEKYQLIQDSKIGIETHLLMNELVNIEQTPVLAPRTHS